ncbi:MAG: hypothetical protein JW990_16395, partial [Thermoleophilia bacterium]|nr:hypothetical protein [Thermoleophilia bacterium]
MKRSVGFSSMGGGAMLAAALLIGVVAAAMPTHAAVIDGTSTAEGYGEPGFEGYWRYCIDVSWDTAEMGGHAMSFVNFFISLGECPCACSPGLVRFAYPAGTGIGEDGCEIALNGIYDCK